MKAEKRMKLIKYEETEGIEGGGVKILSAKRKLPVETRV
jgi:hypothetical protein